jgi:signal peptidase II
LTLRWTRTDTVKWLLAAAVAAVAFTLDWVTKAWVQDTMVVGERHDLLPFFYFERTVNQGVAFGLFSGRISIILVANLLALGVVVAYLLMETRPVIAGVAGGLLIGGSLGNIVERILRDGKVTDFLKIPYYPNFNLADVFIASGAVLVAVSLILAWRRGRPAGADG